MARNRFGDLFENGSEVSVATEDQQSTFGIPPCRVGLKLVNGF
jgi:hypothetical protein